MLAGPIAGRREKRVILCEHLACCFSRMAVFSEAVDIASVDTDLPRDAHDGGEISFKLGDLDFPIVAN